MNRIHTILLMLLVPSLLFSQESVELQNLDTIPRIKLNFDTIHAKFEISDRSGISVSLKIDDDSAFISNKNIMYIISDSSYMRCDLKHFRYRCHSKV
jgi:hypothetical protein